MSDDLSLDARLLRFRSDPGAEPCHELSAALLDAQRAREALEVLSRGLSLREDDVRLLRLAARAFLVEGDVLRAQQTLTRVIRSHPADVEAYRLLAETLLKRGDVGRAQAAVAKALSLAPDDAGLRALRAQMDGSGGPALASESVVAPASEAASAPEVESPPVSGSTDTGALSEASAVPDPRAQHGADAAALGEREELAEDVTRLLAQVMKSTSVAPPPMESPAPRSDAAPASAPPRPSPGLPVAPLPPRPASVAPTGAAPAASARPVVAAGAPAAVAPAAMPTQPAAAAAPVAPAGAPPAGKPGPRRSPTLMGFAPPRPPARPASVPPPARSAPLPAIRPPSVRPPGTGVVPPPNFAPPAMPLPSVAAPEPAPLPLASTPPLAAEASPPVRPPSAPEQEEEDEPTSFMDRESLAGALGVPVSRRESKRPAPAVTTVAVGGAVPTTPVAGRAPAVPLPDTLPEFVVPNLPDAPPADGPRRGDALRVPPRPAANTGEPSPGTPHAAPNDGAEVTPVAVAPRGRRSGRVGLVLLLALVVTLGGGFAAHRAGVLPPAWSSVLDQRWAALVGGPGATEPASQPTPPVVLDAAAEPPVPEVDPAAARVAELDAALAQGRVPSDLPGDAAPESLRLQAEAALLGATPWWSLGATPEGQAGLEPIAGELTAAIEAQPAHAPMLRATAIRVAAARGDAGALADARSLAAEQPDDARVRWALAEALIAAGEAQEADRLLATLVDSGPEPMRARAAVQRAWLAYGRGDHTTARTALDAARALAPGWELVQLRSMDLRLDAGEYRAVLDELGEPGDSEARVLRALRAQLGLEQLEASEALWASLSEDARQRPQVQPLAAQYFMARGEPGEAVRALADLALAEPGDPTLIALYASALYEAGQTLVASAQFERAIALDEGHPEALIGFAQVLLRARKYREARINLDRAEAGLRGRVRPPATLARLRVMRARIMVEERELSQAAVLLRRTLEIEGAPSEGWFYLGEALARSNSPESRAAYERYLSLSPVGPLASRARRAIQ